MTVRRALTAGMAVRKAVQPASPDPGSGGGKAILTDVAATRSMDGLTPALTNLVLQGIHSPSATIDVLNGSGQAFLHYILDSVIVSSIDHSAQRGGAEVETITLAYVSLRVSS